MVSSAIYYLYVLATHCVQLFATPWTVAHQASLVCGILQARILVGCHSLLQRIFLTQGLNTGLLHCRQILYHPKKTFYDNLK